MNEAPLLWQLAGMAWWEVGLVVVAGAGSLFALAVAYAYPGRRRRLRRRD